MALKSTAAGGHRKKKATREIQYKRAKAVEASSRRSGAPSSSKAAGQRSNVKGKAKAKDVEDNSHPFRYKSFNDRLASVHINVGNSLGRSGTGALAGLEGHGILPVAGSSSKMQIDGDSEGEDNSDGEEEDGLSQLHAKTSFGVALLSWKELNLSLPFTLIAQQIQPLSLSLPMLLHHQTTIARLLTEGLMAHHRDSYLGYEPMLDLIPRLANDLGSSFLPCFPDLLAATLRITTISKLNTEGEEYTAAMLVERAFESTAATLRCVAPFVLREQKSTEGEERDWLQRTWQIVSPYLGGSEMDQAPQEDTSPNDGDDGEAGPAARIPVPRSKRAKIPPHTRRFASEALAHLVRRAKGEQLSKVASVMMKDLKHDVRSGSPRTRTFASGIAGVWVEVAKSVDHRLHSSAASHLSALLLPAQADSDEQATLARAMVGNDVITALVHHGQAIHLAVLFDWLADVAEARLGSKTGDAASLSPLNEAISWLTAFVGTRKGKRVDDSIKPRLFHLLVQAVNALQSKPLADERVAAGLLQFITISLPLGRIQDLVGPGKRVVEQLAQQDAEQGFTPAFAALATSLGQEEFAFDGYRQVVLPAVMKVTSHTLEGKNDLHLHDLALSLLATLQQQVQFAHLSSATPSSTTTAWSRAVSISLGEKLRRWCAALQTSESSDEGMLAVLSLVSLFPAQSNLYLDSLCQSICLLSSTSNKDAQSAFATSPINPAGLLAASIGTLADLVDAGTVHLARSARERLTRDAEVQNIPLRFAWHRNVVCSHARLCSAMHQKNLTLPAARLDQTGTALEEALMSADEPLRLAAARLLSMAEEQSKGEEEESVLVRLVEIEETALEVETVRERNVRMRAVAREVVRLKSGDKVPTLLDTCASIVVRYLTSVFKLNFRPLWEESKKALVDLSVVYGQLVWQAAFSELKEVQPLKQLPKSWSASRLSHTTLLDKLISEEEESIDRCFRDPQLAERRQIVVDGYSRDVGGAVLQATIDAQRPGGRLDLINYQSLLLKLFASISNLAERNNAPLMQHFFDTIVSRQEDAEESEEGGEGEGEDEDEDEGKGEEGKPDDEEKKLGADGGKDGPVRLTMMQRRAQLCAYLETFGQFSNPKALYRSEDLHRYLYTLCSQGDNKVQVLALDVVLRWKDPSQVTYSSMLKKLTDQTNFREELTSLTLAPGGETIQESHRSGLLPLLIRLFFGIMVSKRGRASQGSGQAGRKNAILVALSDLESEELTELVEVMLEPFEDQRGESGETFRFSHRQPLASLSRQSGYLSLLADVVKHLGLRMIPLWDRLLTVALNLTYHASRRVEASKGKAATPDRSIRQSGIRRLDDFFKQPTEAFDWSPYMAAIFEHLVSPRLASLRTESIQSPSALLDLIQTWSSNSDSVFYLVRYDTHLLEHVCACLRAPSVKPSVIAKVLDVVEAVQSYPEGRDRDAGLAVRVQVELLQPFSSVLLAGLTPLVHRCNSTTGVEAKALHKDDLLRRLLQLLSKLSPYIATASDASALLDALAPMLRKSNAVVGERSKVDLLLVFERLLLLVPEMQDASTEAFSTLYTLFSGLFSKLRSKGARSALCGTFAMFANTDASLSRVVNWISDLNSYDAKRMEEYDFEKRLAVFDAINGASLQPAISEREWLPLLQNCLFNLQDADELAIRANAGSSLRTFIDVVAADEPRKPTAGLFTNVVYPGLRRGLRSKSDLVQREVVSILGYAVSRLGSSMDYLYQMNGLLMSGDEEASFFNNIYHIQIHRRIRALNRLGQEAERGAFTSRLIVEIFLPLVDQFLNTDSHHGDANLIQSSVDCLGKLSMRLKWGPYNVLLWKFLSIGKQEKEGGKEKEKEKSDKVCVRAAMTILDHFHFQMTQTLDEDDEEGEEGEEDEGGERENRVEAKAQAQETEKVLGAVQTRLLPKLMDFLDQKDDLEDSVRLPIAVGVARVLLRLPHLHGRIAIIKLLTTLSNVFKSKAQDTRDLARTTLAKVAFTLGPDYLPLIVKELRRALTRGPQRAVLAYTVHNILTQTIAHAERPLQTLNLGTSDVMEVVMEDVFGQTSEDRDSIENRTTYKEVKATKSLDTLEQVAKIVDPTQIAALLAPIKSLMHQTEAVKAVRSMDDCLKRAAAGLNVNPHLSTSDLLLLCHSLLTSNADFLKAPPRRGKGGKTGAGAVLLKRRDVEEGASRDHYGRNAYKFVSFGLDMLGNALRRAKFDYSDADTLAKLDPMVNAVGNGLYAQQAAIITASLKVLALLVKCPVPSVEGAMALIVKQTLRIVEKEGSNAQSDVLMAALKLLTVVIRDVPSAALHESQIRQLSQLIDMNLDQEAEMQGVLFGLLRGIVGQKIVVAEVYDVMDRVATMMVTNQSNSIRDQARSVYLSFLLELPQGQQRFSNQMHFLAKNVSYVFESGRLSLLDFLRVMLLKMNEEVLRDYLNLFFVSLVMCLGNDESSKCKEKAAKLIVQIVDLSRPQERDNLVGLVHLWAQSNEQADLTRIAMMIYGLFTEAASLQVEGEQDWKGKALAHTRRVLLLYVGDLEEEEMTGEGEENGEEGGDWQLAYQALQLVGKLFNTSKRGEVERDGETWQAVRDLLLFPHSWVRAAACRLMGQRMALEEVQRPQGGEGSFLSLGNLLNMAKKLSLMLKGTHLDEALALQLVKNLLFIGKCFALVPVAASIAEEDDAGDSGEDGDEDEGEGEGEGVERRDWSTVNPLRWLFTKLSHQLRQCKLSSASIETLSLLQPSTLLKWLAAMVNHLSSEQSKLFLMQIIAPLYRLLEADANLARRSSDFANLQSLANEVQDLVQGKVGTTAYAATYTTIKQRMVERKTKRKNDALMLAIEQPAKAMQRKAAVNKRKHDSRKRKTQSYAHNKDRVRPTKRQR